jgi:cell division protein ZapA (FtsZ GTPase activity inhibitor)
MKNILISHEQLERLTNQVKETKEEGSYMSKKQLFTIATLAYKMWEEMEDGEQIEDWMESKIAQSEQSIVAVTKDYMYNEFTEKGGMDKLGFDELIIGK